MKQRHLAHGWQGVAIRNTVRGAIAASTLLFSIPTAAQIVPDATLPVNSIVTPIGNTFTINGGSRAGGNLFHSFREFSLPTGGEAFFNNAVDVQNIFSRVTGSNISNIDGLIRANGTANLFLLNPNGIIFGPNARLDLNGSFIGTTASSIKFADGVELSATNPATSPLLTVSVPVGLQMGQNPGTIQVQGIGHTQTYPRNTAIPFDRNNSSRGLEVSAGRTLGLIGGNIVLESGVLTAEGGHIELGAVSANPPAPINLSSTASGWRFGYDGIINFGDIRLNERSLVDASGIGSGSIQLQGQQVTLLNASTLLIQNTGSQAAGAIQVNASEALVMQGNSLGGKAISNVRTANMSSGRGANIEIDAPQVTLRNGAQLDARAFGSGAGGTVQIRASDRIEIDGFATGNPNTRSSIATVNHGAAGSSGNILISTNQLNQTNGGTITSVSLGINDSGNVTVDVRDAIQLSGVQPSTLLPSQISVLAFGSGDAGRLIINTRRINITNGAVISGSTLASGSAGDVTINASESVEVEGQFVAGSIIRPSQILAASDLSYPSVRQSVGLPPFPTGGSGNLNINTPTLRVLNRGVVSVRNDSDNGNAGSLRINADSVILDNQGRLTATAREGRGGDIILNAQTLNIRNRGQINTSTLSGEGGNIEINLQGLLFMRNTGLINSESLGTGNGGSIHINSPTIVGLENSDIIANAVRGNGGNIQINTQGIFGLQNRPQLTPGSDITASSQFGLSGNVAITNPELETKSFLVELPQNLVDTSGQITTGCDSTKGNTFTIAGRGGLPEDPISGLLGRAIWFDDRDLSADGNTASLPGQSLPKSEPSPEIVEANGWIVNEKGQVELVAHHSNRANSWQAPANCPPHQSSSLR